jgi:nicotinate-nucleotide adenylyltransferase
MRLALFGGTFDPVHNAHLEIARAAVRQFRLGRVLFIPAGLPPHKSKAHAAYADRLRMLELACASEPAFEVSRLEEGEQRSYSMDTVERVRGLLSEGDELFFLIGADAFAEIETWRRWQELLRSVAFIVVSRPGHTYRVPEGARICRLEQVELPVSSTVIRGELARGRTAVPVPPAVLDYILHRKLYGL